MRVATAPRAGEGGLGEGLYGRVGEFDATWCLRVMGGCTGHPDGCLLGRNRRASWQHDLGQPGSVADDQKGHLGELAPAMDPALEPDRAVGEDVRELGGRCAWWFHRGLQGGDALEAWAKGSTSRCHHTFAGRSISCWASLSSVTPNARCPALRDIVRFAGRLSGSWGDSAMVALRRIWSEPLPDS